MGRLMGIEPTNAGTTIRCVNHFATTAIIKFYVIYYKSMNGATDGNRTHECRNHNPVR